MKMYTLVLGASLLVAGAVSFAQDASAADESLTSYRCHGSSMQYPGMFVMAATYQDAVKQYQGLSGAPYYGILCREMSPPSN